MRTRTIATVLALLAANFSCRGFLEAENNDSPDVAATLATPAGINAIVGTLYQAIWITSTGVTQPGQGLGIYAQMLTMSFESFMFVGQSPGLRGMLPRTAISNARGNTTGVDNFRDYSGLSRNSRTASNVIIALDKLVASGQSLGSVALNARARAFAFFANGVSLGNMALAYDSAAIIHPSVPSGDVPPLSAAAEVMNAALSNLDSAIVIASDPGAASAFPLPISWINGQSLSAPGFVQMVRSYRARFRAGVARTPGERAAADWSAIIDDVNGGIRADLNVLLDPATGWTQSWFSTHYRFGVFHQMTPMILGMADTTGAYETWLKLPLGDRSPFLIRTLDRRLPPGETRAAQVANSPAVPTGMRYFRNRSPADDATAPTWGSSDYDHYRWRAIFDAGLRGDFPIITLAEMDMLAAEGHLRRGEIALAAALIDKYRVRAGLPVLTGVISSLATPLPGPACVPRVPTSAGNATSCGTIFEAMKWEKRMETAFTGWTSWYFDSRGWGDLPEGTPLEFPVPYQELDARRKPLYNLGGIGGKSAAGRGTYGF
jgi:hypothetical protein